MFAKRVGLVVACAVLAGVAARAADPPKPMVPPVRPVLPPDPPKLSDQKSHKVHFKDAKWDDVFVHYARVTGLTSRVSSLPKGTFTFEPKDRDKRHTVPEITDLINDELMKQNFVLVRRQLTFVVVDLNEEAGPEDLTTYAARIPLDELAERGRTELVQVMLSTDADVTDAKDELSKILTPFGTIVKVESKQVTVCDLAGNVRRIKEIVAPCGDKK